MRLGKKSCTKEANRSRELDSSVFMGAMRSWLGARIVYSAISLIAGVLIELQSKSSTRGAVHDDQEAVGENGDSVR